MPRFIILLLLSIFLAIVPDSISLADDQFTPDVRTFINPEQSYSNALNKLVEESGDEVENLDKEIKHESFSKRKEIREGQAREFYEKGLELIEQGKLNEARSYFEKAIHITEQVEMIKQVKASEQRIKAQEAALKRAKEDQKHEQIQRIKQNQQEIENVYQQAVFLYRNKEYDQAKDAFTNVDQLSAGYKATRSYLNRIDQDALEQFKQDQKASKTVDYRQLRQSAQDRALEQQRIQEEQEKAQAQEIQKQELEQKRDLEHQYKQEIQEKRDQEERLLKEQTQQRKRNELELENVYQQALTLYSQRNYAEAKDVFNNIDKLSPGYKSTNSYLLSLQEFLDKQAQLKAQHEQKLAEVAQVREEEERRQEFLRKQQEAREKFIKQTDNDYRDALDLYKNNQTQEAKEKFVVVGKKIPGYKETDYYLWRIDRYLANQQRLQEQQEAVEQRRIKEQKEKQEREEIQKQREKLEQDKELERQQAREQEEQQRQREKDLEEEYRKEQAAKQAREQEQRLQEQEKALEQQRSELQEARQEKQRLQEKEQLLEQQSLKEQERKLLQPEQEKSIEQPSEPEEESPAKLTEREKWIESEKDEQVNAVIHSVENRPKKELSKAEQVQEAKLVTDLAQKSSRLYNEMAGLDDDNNTNVAKKKLAKIDKVFNNLKEEKERTLTQMREEELPPMQQAQENYDQALSLLKSKDFQGAKEKLLKVENIQPDFKSSRTYLSYINRDQRKAEELALLQRTHEGEMKIQQEYIKRKAQEEQMSKEKLAQQKGQLAQIARKAARINDEILALTNVQNYAGAKLKLIELEKVMESLKKKKALIARENELQAQELRVFKEKENIPSGNRGDALYYRGLELYRTKKYGQAKIVFDQLDAQGDNRASIYLKRIDRLMKVNFDAATDSNGQSQGQGQMDVDRTLRERQEKFETQEETLRNQLNQGVEAIYQESVKLYRSANYRDEISKALDIFEPRTK